MTKQFLNDYLLSQRDLNDPEVRGDNKFCLAKRITCADGFSLSVQAGWSAYCSPRTNNGPWYNVEVGFPSATPEFIMSFAEQADTPTDTVYAYVPVDLVEELITFHGGMLQ